MLGLAEARYADVWYAACRRRGGLPCLRRPTDEEGAEARNEIVTKARSKNSLHVFDKLTEHSDDGYRIVSQPPLLIPLREIPNDHDPEALVAAILQVFQQYVDTLPDHVKVLVERYRYRDMAIKVVGVGSVGTRCWIVLLEGRSTAYQATVVPLANIMDVGFIILSRPSCSSWPRS